MSTISHALFIVLFLFDAQTPASQTAAARPPAKDEFVQWADPPGALTTEESQLLAEARSALESRKSDVSAVLIDSKYAGLHAHTEFRELIAAHASAKPLTIAGADEPGPRLTVRFEFVGPQQRPIADALVYVYHTSAKGWYSDKGAHIRANSGDVNHARLFGYARTDSQGKLELRTIRPSGYPQSELPAHIHLGLKVGGKPVGVGEVRFDDDPRMTPEMRKKSLEERDVIVKVQTAADGSQRCDAKFEVNP